MKKYGYTYIATIFVVLLISIGLYFLIATPMERVSNNFEDSIQGKYIVESIGNYIISQGIEDLVIEANLTGESRNLDLSGFNFFQDVKNSSANLNIDTRYDNHRFIIDIVTEYKGVEFKGSIGGSIINPIFESLPIISPRVTSYRDEFINFSRGISNWDLDVSSGFVGYVGEYSQDILIENGVISSLNDGTELGILDSRNILRVENALLNINTYNGILIVKGRLETIGTPRLNGILILDGGTLEGDLIVSGITLNLRGTDDSYVNSTYNNFNLKVFGKYLPGYFKPSVKYLKKVEDLYF